MVKSELMHLRIIFDEGTIIIALKNILKVRNKEVRHREYIAKHNVPARDIDLDLLHFKPKHCKAADWGDAYI